MFESFVSVHKSYFSMCLWVDFLWPHRPLLPAFLLTKIMGRCQKILSISCSAWKRRRSCFSMGPLHQHLPYNNHINFCRKFQPCEVPGWHEPLHLWSCSYATGSKCDLVPSRVQDSMKVTARMLEDKDWLDKVYFPTNHQRFHL